jgi:hypothetical protein
LSTSWRAHALWGIGVRAGDFDSIHFSQSADLLLHFSHHMVLL